MLDADIRDFFGSLDRELLMERVQRRVSDRRVLSLIWKWLDAGVMEDGRETKLLSGTPQGGVISPLLSNIYLSYLDERWTHQCANIGTLVRYADDFVIVCNTWTNLDEAERRVKIVSSGLSCSYIQTRRERWSCAMASKASIFSGATCTSACRAGSGRTNANAFTFFSAGRRRRA